MESEPKLIPKKRCPNGTNKNKSGICVEKKATSPKPKPQRTRKNIPSKKPNTDLNKITLEEATEETRTLLTANPTIKVSKPTILHLFHFINKLNPAQLRVRNEEAMLPLENYPNDKGVLLYLFREIMDLSINRTRDSKKKTVSVKIIGQVIQNDDQLRILFAA
jgi:hypothetical protein